jgi:hypothetical protein
MASRSPKQTLPVSFYEANTQNSADRRTPNNRALSLDEIDANTSTVSSDREAGKVDRNKIGRNRDAAAAWGRLLIERLFARTYEPGTARVVRHSLILKGP